MYELLASKKIKIVCLTTCTRTKNKPHSPFRASSIKCWTEHGEVDTEDGLKQNFPWNLISFHGCQNDFIGIAVIDGLARRQFQVFFTWLLDLLFFYQVSRMYTVSQWIFLLLKDYSSNIWEEQSRNIKKIKNWRISEDRNLKKNFEWWKLGSQFFRRILGIYMWL